MSSPGDPDKREEVVEDPELESMLVKPKHHHPFLSQKCNSIEELLRIDEGEEKEPDERPEEEEKGSVAKSNRRNQPLEAVLDIVKNTFQRRQRVSAPTWNLLTSMVNHLIHKISTLALQHAERNNNKMIDSQHITSALEELKLDRLLDKMVEGGAEIKEGDQEKVRGGDNSLLKFRNSEGGEKRARNMKLERVLKEMPKNKRKQMKKAWKSKENEEELRREQELLFMRAKSSDHTGGFYGLNQTPSIAMQASHSMYELKEPPPPQEIQNPEENFDE